MKPRRDKPLALTKKRTKPAKEPGWPGLTPEGVVEQQRIVASERLSRLEANVSRLLTEVQQLHGLRERQTRQMDRMVGLMALLVANRSK